MRRPFHIERVGDPKKFKEFLKDKIILHTSPIINRFNNQALIFEDLRTIIELNKTIEDLMTEKYVFYKLYGFSKLQKQANRGLDDVKYELETYNTLLIQSLFTTVIVTYAKWFTNSSGGNKIKLEEKEVFKDFPKTLLRTHELVMAYRHAYFAHSGPTNLENIYPIYIQNLENPQNEFLTFFPSKTRLPKLAEVRRFHKLFSRVIQYISIKMESMKPKVISEIRLKMK